MLYLCCSGDSLYCQTPGPSNSTLPRWCWFSSAGRHAACPAPPFFLSSNPTIYLLLLRAWLRAISRAKGTSRSHTTPSVRPLPPPNPQKKYIYIYFFFSGRMKLGWAQNEAGAREETWVLPFSFLRFRFLRMRLRWGRSFFFLLWLPALPFFCPRFKSRGGTRKILIITNSGVLYFFCPGWCQSWGGLGGVCKYMSVTLGVE